MKRRTSILLAILEAAFVLAAVYFEPTCCVRGRLRGEAFYDGKSTSWWRGELERWDVEFVPHLSIAPGSTQLPTHYYAYNRNSTWLEDTRDRGLQLLQSDDQVVREKAIRMMMAEINPVLVRGDPKAIPVLNELLNDPSPKVRHFARVGLKMKPEAPRGN